MDSLLTRKMLGVAAALALSACGGSGAGVPSVDTAQFAQSRAEQQAASSKLSGQYSGTIVDSVTGTRKATLWLAQQQNALGGHVTAKDAPGFNESVALAASGDKVRGYSVLIKSASAYCSFYLTGKYTNDFGKLGGSFRPSYGCSGETGTFTFTHECYFKGLSADVRQESGVHGC